MAMSDPIGDMLTRIRNGQAAGKTALVPGVEDCASSRARGLAARGLHPRLLWAEKSARMPEFTIELKYHEGAPVIRDDRPDLQAGPPRLFRIATCRRSPAGSASPSCRRRAASCRIAEARAANVGGEVLCQVF
jgi:small subunit ribosomal protein S8